ncbi:hypothetical protein [Diaphorobacter sp. J5-51]|uniref:hypothetical protein n=1 Tax=Diaphorobacter sp. J5-51 TaxID=680496 RepID=UPI000643B866|nr:hypothetical protein [Diaphorobacter sp. J5-51]KLR57427.1 hypothetical protein OX89_12460 [Diaphorobacter sp. J5-51]
MIGRQAYAEAHARRDQAELARIAQIAEDCDAFVRQAMEYLVEPRGLRQATVERAKTRRGWPKRHAALVDAHAAWVDVVGARCTNIWAAASVRRAQAAYTLLCFALGDWTIPEHIRVPRAASS